MAEHQKTETKLDELHEGEFLLVKKPQGWTSFDVIGKLRKILQVRKAGHAGTLDPMATGLLIVCTGRMTKTIEQFMGLEKEYEVTMVLGGQTESYDATMPVIRHMDASSVTEEDVRKTLAGFTGTQVQLPPPYSAVKVKGKRLYKYARQRIPVERPSREVNIRSVTLTSFDTPAVSFAVVCSKGTYVRTLVHDVGLRLGCGAYVSRLHRTRIGPYQESKALTIEEINRSHGVSPRHTL